MPERVFALAVSLLLAAALGCAPTYYDTYKEKEPYWFGGGPTGSSTLHEVLATLYAPPVADYSLIVAKLSVLRLEEGGPVELTQEEIDATLASDASGDYGVIATLSCRSEFNLQRYYGEKVTWYQLTEGKLVAYDHFDFVDLCTVSNQFQPAPLDGIELEAQVIAYRDKYFPKSMEHVGMFYMRGLAYMKAKRPDDAVRMLQAGDEGLDVGQRGERHQDKETGTQIRSANSSDIDRVREALVESLGAAEVEVPES